MDKIINSIDQGNTSSNKKSGYEHINKRTIYIDRKPLWISDILDHYRGYTVDFPSLLESADPIRKQVLIDDLHFFGLQHLIPSAPNTGGDDDDHQYTKITDIEELKKILTDFTNNFYLQLGDEKLYNEITMYLGRSEQSYSLHDVQTMCEKAHNAVEFAEYKEYITSWFMKVAGYSLKFWGEKTGVDTNSLHESIETRLSEDDELLGSVHDFSDSMKSFPFLSWTVDNVKLFIVNYFVKTQTA